MGEELGRSGGVLVTRPEPDAQETAARLVAMGFTPVLSPVLSITVRPLRVRAGTRWQAVLVTSSNAIAALPSSLHATPLLAVGDATAARARASGFWRVSSAGRDAAALVGLVPICCAPDGASLLLPTGAGQGMAVAQALRSRDFRVVRRVVYTARSQRRLLPAARAALLEGRVGAALFFSPDSARAFVLACGPSPALRQVRAVAISAATAAALAPLQWRDIRVASHPNQDELLACLT